MIRTQMQELQFKLEQDIAAMIKERSIACAQLTKDQLASLITQMIVSGDIIKNVRIHDHAQSIIYVPFEGQERLKDRIDNLEAALYNIASYANTVRLDRKRGDMCLQTEDWCNGLIERVEAARELLPVPV